MWTLETPTMEIIFRAIFIYLFVFVICRIWGKKHFGEMTNFDFVLLLIISEAVQNSLVDQDSSMQGGMISVATLILMNVAFSRITYASRRAEKFVEGVPQVLIKDGKVNEDVMRKEKLTDQDLRSTLRLQGGVAAVEDVKEAVIEPNGHISVLKKEEGPRQVI